LQTIASAVAMFVFFIIVLSLAPGTQMYNYIQSVVSRMCQRTKRIRDKATVNLYKYSDLWYNYIKFI